MSVPNSVSIPLYLSATSSREITVTFTVTPSMYMSFIESQVVFPPATRMQVRTVRNISTRTSCVKRMEMDIMTEFDYIESTHF